MGCGGRARFCLPCAALLSTRCPWLFAPPLALMARNCCPRPATLSTRADSYLRSCGSFGEADKEFQMSADEIETLAVGDEFASPFAGAFERAAFVKETKASKGRYSPQVL